MAESANAIAYLIDRDERLAAIIDAVGTIAINTSADPFPFLVHEVIEQMLSTKVGDRINDRVTGLCGGNVGPDAIARLTADDLRATGMSYRKAETILMFSKTYDAEEFARDASRTDEEIIHRICAMPGFGPWSAKMYLIFSLEREDVLPYEDGAFLQVYKWLYNARVLKPKTIRRRCAPWRPYSSIAARYFYHALDMGLTKQPVNEFLAEYAIGIQAS